MTAVVPRWTRRACHGKKLVRGLWLINADNSCQKSSPSTTAEFVGDFMPSLFRKFQTRLKAFLAGATVGDQTVIDENAVLKRDGGSIVIGRNCQIHRDVQLLAYGGNIKIGDDCSINPGCILYGHGGLKIGNHVRIAALCVMVPANHNFNDAKILIKDQGESRQGIVIGNDVWIGAHVTILDGVNVADGSVIGAGAVVTKSTEALGIYVGNPARLVRRRGE